MSGPGSAAGGVRWPVVEELFHQLSSLPVERWTAYLTEAEGLAVAERNALLALLAAEMAVAERIREGVAEEAVGVVGTQSHDHWLGRLIGPFRLKELLGKGGMGRVYRGEREQRGLVQVVAVKLIAQLLPTPMAERSFEEETRALARLEHPNIARLVDGGVTDEGLPWLAMEFVDGTLVDAHCDAAVVDGSVGLRAVVGLAASLCSAVGYLHGELLLHRDLKPGNVLIARDGMVKLLDFGTLKALAAGEPDGAATRLGMRSLTLRYASPEQLRGEVLTTASDVFSLGMTLYRMLMGRLPEEFGEPGSPGYLRAMEQTGWRPVWGQLRDRWGISAVLARDLETILFTALRFRAAERYQEAEALGSDLHAALASRPLRAAGHGRLVHLWRFVRRHRTLLSLAGAAAMVASVSTVVLLRQDRVIRTERARAEQALHAEAALNHFLLVDFFEQLKQIPGSTAAQRKAVEKGLASADRLATLSDRREVQLDRVQAYTEMGSLQGDPYESNLDETEGAVKTLGKAVALARAMAAEAPGEASTERAAAAAEHALGETLFGMGKPEEARLYLLPAAESMQRLADAKKLDAAGMAEAAAFANSVGDLYFLDGAVSLGDRGSSVVWGKRSLELEERGLAMDAGCARCRRGKAVEEWKLGLAEDDPAAALVRYEQGLSTLRACSPAERETARVRRLDTLLQQRVGWAKMQMGHTAEGAAILNEMRRRFQEAIAQDPLDERARFDLVALDFTTGEGLDERQKPELAEELARESLEQVQALQRKDPANEQLMVHEADALEALGTTESRRGHEREADVLYQQAADRMMQLAQKPDADGSVLEGAAEALVFARRKGPEAEALARRAMQGRTVLTAADWVTLGEAQTLAGEAGAARDSARHAMQLLAGLPESLNRRRLLQRAQDLMAGAVRRTT